MAIGNPFLQNPENVATGWGPMPQLHAPEIGSLIGSILRDRLAKQQLQQEQIANAVKEIQQQRQASAYTDALRNAGLTQGQDISGLSSADATRLAAAIQAQTPDTQMDAYHQAAAAKEQAIADYIKQNGQYPGRGGSGGVGLLDENGVERAVGETWIGSDGKERIMTARQGPKLTAVAYQSPNVRPPSESGTYQMENDLLRQKENLDLARKIQEQADITAKRANVPFAQETQYQQLLKDLQTVQARRRQAAPVTDQTDTETTQPQTGATPPPTTGPTPSDKAGGHAPDYGVPVPPGIASSRDAAVPGQTYYAPDGSVRVRGND